MNENNIKFKGYSIREMKPAMYMQFNNKINKYNYHLSV